MTSIAPSPVITRLFDPGVDSRLLSLPRSRGKIEGRIDCRIEAGNRGEQQGHHAEWAGKGVLRSQQGARVSAEVSMFQEFDS
jgi:hypothetical protein